MQNVRLSLFGSLVIACVVLSLGTVTAPARATDVPYRSVPRAVTPSKTKTRTRTRTRTKTNIDTQHHTDSEYEQDTECNGVPLTEPHQDIDGDCLAHRECEANCDSAQNTDPQYHANPDGDDYSRQNCKYYHQRWV